MTALHDLSYLFGGAFLVNALPHFISGSMGRAFQTPFADPPGQGLSSSSLNVIWGAANLVAAYLLLARVGDFDIRAVDHALSAGLGGLLMALFLARRFGRINGGHTPGKP